jgi:hypothetical protein
LCPWAEEVTAATWWCQGRRMWSCSEAVMTGAAMCMHTASADLPVAGRRIRVEVVICRLPMAEAEAEGEGGKI